MAAGFFGLQPPIDFRAKFNPPTAGGTVSDYALVFGDLTKTGDDRSSYVTRATWENISGTAYVVDPNQTGSGVENPISLTPVSARIGRPIPILTDQNIALGDVLGPQPGTYFARRGAMFTDWALKAIEAQDRSTTAGTVLCDVVPALSARDRLLYQMEQYDDFGYYTTAHEGWVTIAASGTVAGTTAGAIGSLGGLVVLTAQAADNASAILHRQLVGGGYGCAVGKPWLFECRASFGVDTLTGYYLGLLDGSQTIAATLPIADAGTTVTADLAGFFKAEGGSTEVGITYGASTAGTSTTTRAVTVNEMVRRAILWDGVNSIQFATGSTKLGSSVTTTTAIPAADTALLPVFQVKNASTTAGVMNLDYFRGIQVR